MEKGRGGGGGGGGVGVEVAVLHQSPLLERKLILKFCLDMVMPSGDDT
jgi:hypothetical protein